MAASGSVRPPPRETENVSTCRPSTTSRQRRRPPTSSNAICSTLFGKPQMPWPAAQVKRWSTGSVTSRPSKTQRRPAVATASSAMERSSTAPRGRDANSHPLHALGQDLVHDAHLARLAERVLVLAEVLLRERVDVRVGALLRR